MYGKNTSENTTDRLTVHLNGEPVYDIVMTQDFNGLQEEVRKHVSASGKLCIVTDSTVSELYLREVAEILSSCCSSVISYVFPAGEAHKNLSTVQKLYERLILERFDRSDMLVALGGGVVGDLCGFAAATYLRGISFIQIPTTLLSQVDSSIGGKTGVDFDSYKNMVGAFHMPKLVYTNIRTLLTLPDNEFAAGLGNGLQEEVRKHVSASGKLCIVTDSTVSELYLREVAEILSSCCSSVISYVFPAGEAHKNLSTVQKLYERLILERFDRSDMLVALGGGVVGDLCGFAAATYLRGISFIQIPTTLLSQVDSSIGGKTGVDFDSYKNMVGAFHMPKLVYTNIRTLLTLPDNEFAAGLGEVIKHGLIRDREYYDWLLSHAGEIEARDLTVLRQTVAGSNLIKRKVVETDPTEKGDRMLLNFGHTLGHAIEKLKNFELLHGECVALGALAAMRLSESRGMITEAETERFKEALMRFHIAVRVSGLTAGDIIEATKNDKKMESGVINFILLKSVGCAYVDRTVTDGEMEEALKFILTQEEFNE